MRGLLVALWCSTSTVAWGQTVPRRQIPPSVLTELGLLEQRFELALAGDCHPKLCYSKGCAYGAHAVADQRRSSSMPGLGEEAGPGSVESQEFLTQATCSFAYEPSVTALDAEALGRRLQSKMSHGFTVVSVSRQELQPLPPELQLPPAPPAEEEPPPPPPPPEPPVWSLALASRELWTTLLPHFAWMIAVGMLTVAATVLFWAWRRVGRESIEERALLAQMLREDAAAPPEVAEPVEAPPEEDDGPDFVERESTHWNERVAAFGPEHPDPELQGLIHELLRDRDLPTLAKATLEFPESFLACFPAGGDIAATKLELAQYLKTVPPEDLPSDEAFFRTLARVGRSAALSSQSDAQLFRSLREEFGAPGLVALVGQLAPRSGALIFALSAPHERFEMVRLLPPGRQVVLTEQLIRSNRMDQAETTHLFSVLKAARAGQPLPPPPPSEVSERGITFDAAGPLSMLLGALPVEDRLELLDDAVERFSGSLPSWYQGILFTDMLFALPDQSRADVFLGVEAEGLAAWMMLQDEAPRARLTASLPRALRASLDSFGGFGSLERKVAIAEAARSQLAKGLVGALAGAGVPFEQAIRTTTAAAEPVDA